MLFQFKLSHVSWTFQQNIHTPTDTEQTGWHIHCTVGILPLVPFQNGMIGSDHLIRAGAHENQIVAPLKEKSSSYNINYSDAALLGTR